MWTINQNCNFLLHFPKRLPLFTKYPRQHTKKWKHQKTKLESIFCIFSGIFSSFFILFTGILGFFQALDIKELLTICTLTATRWHWPAAPLSTLENFCQRTKVTFADRNVPPQLALLFFDIFFLFFTNVDTLSIWISLSGSLSLNDTRETMMLGF